MNKKKLAIIISVFALVIICAAITVSAVFDMTKPVAVMNGMLGLENMPGYADANEDGKVNVLDIIVLMREQKLGDVYLSGISLDDANYSIGTFSKDTNTYTVNLPDGRPSIPQVSATAAEGLSVEITQAYIPDGKTDGKAYIQVSDGDMTNTYTVIFIRDKANGFVLQYDDRYEFPLENRGGYSFESSNTEALTVDENGLMTAKKVTNDAITVTATNGTNTETLIIDRIEKAHVNLFFITGQSNGQGCFDNVSMNGEEVDASAQERYYGYMEEVEEIGQDGRVYSYDVHPRTENIAYLKDIGLLGENETLQNRLYDMNVLTKQGHQASLGKTWYDLTGEKVVFLQSAWSGAPIESWLDPERYDEAGGYGNATRNFYNTTKAGYKALTALLSENYEIIRKANFWCQGETAMTAYYDKSTSDYITSSGNPDIYDTANLMTSQTYSEYFMRIHNDMKEDFGLEYSGIMMVRNRTTSSRAKISSLVTSFFELVNTNEEVFLATRKFVEIARTESSSDKSEGWGFIDVKDLHYSQSGYNYHGKEAADNFFGYVYGDPTYIAKDVEIIDTNGKTRLENNTEKDLEAGKTYQIATLPLPWNSGEDVLLSSSNTAVATVDQFGLITAVSAGRAEIKATAESGASRTLVINVYEVGDVEYNYRWDFADLTSSEDENTLSISPLSSVNEANYSLTTLDGETFYYSQQSTTSKRPDFVLEKPFTLDSDSDWEIEWRGMVGVQQAVIFMGQTPNTPVTDSTHFEGYIYFYTHKDYNASVGRAIKISTGTSSKYLSMDTTTAAKMYEMNSWRIEYKKDSNEFTLLLQNDSGTWDTVTTTTAGTFSFEISNIFGRLNGVGSGDFVGTMDYIDVHIDTTGRIDG